MAGRCRDDGPVYSACSKAQNSDTVSINHTVKDEEEDFIQEEDEDYKELDLSNERIKDLELVKLNKYKNLNVLVLRRNLIVKINAIGNHDSLEELDLYDNRINVIENLGHLKSLKNVYLDLSFNKIKEIENLSELGPTLDSLFLAVNRIKVIKNMDKLTNITNLELGGNQIEKIQNLDTLVNLKQLWLAKNRITKIENLETLVNLEILSLQNNKIKTMEGLSELKNLRELYLGYNHISKIQGLENTKSIKVFDISSNDISDLQNLESLEDLEDLWANNNNISSFRQVQEQLANKKNLKTVYFEKTPLESVGLGTYRARIKHILPQITQLDANITRNLA